ncbi:MAG: hypothetical protein K5919_01890 [Clostridiales bacterium]|nr:hypothetical protein [Clostridiales bacterium]
MPELLGLPLKEALSLLPPGAPAPRVTFTAAPKKNGETRQDGTVRLVCVRGDEWIAAQFMDRQPQGKEEA